MVTQVSVGATRSKADETGVTNNKAEQGKAKGAAWDRAKSYLGLSEAASQPKLHQSARQIFENLAKLTNDVQVAISVGGAGDSSAQHAAETLKEVAQDLGRQFASGDLASVDSIDVGSQSFNPKLLLQEISNSFDGLHDVPLDELQADFPLLAQFQKATAMEQSLQKKLVKESLNQASVGPALIEQAATHPVPDDQLSVEQDSTTQDSFPFDEQGSSRLVNGPLAHQADPSVRQAADQPQHDSVSQDGLSNLSALRTAAAGLPEVLALLDPPASVVTYNPPGPVDVVSFSGSEDAAASVLSNASPGSYGFMVDMDEEASLSLEDDLISLPNPNSGSKLARYAEGINKSLRELKNTESDPAVLQQLTHKLQSVNTVFVNALAGAGEDAVMQADCARHCARALDGLIGAKINNRALFEESSPDAVQVAFFKAFDGLQSTVSLNGGAALLALQNLASLQEPGEGPATPHRALASLMTPKMQGDPKNQVLVARTLTRIAQYIALLENKTKQAASPTGHRQVPASAIDALGEFGADKLIEPLKNGIDKVGGDTQEAISTVLASPQSFGALVNAIKLWAGELSQKWDHSSNAGTLRQVGSIYTTGMNLGSRSTRIKQFQNELFGTLGHEIQWSKSEGQPSLRKYADPSGKISDSLADNFDTLMTKQSLVQTSSEKGSFNARRFQSALLASNMAYDGINLNTRVGNSKENRFRVDALSLDQKLNRNSLVRLTELSPKANKLGMQVEMQNLLQRELQPRMQQYFAGDKAQQLLAQAISRDELAQIAIMAINATSSEQRIVHQSDVRKLLNAIDKWQGGGHERNLDGSRIGIKSSRFTAPTPDDKAKLDQYLARVLLPEIEVTSKQGRRIQSLMTGESLNAFNATVRQARSSQPFRAITGGGFLGANSLVQQARNNMRNDAFSLGRYMNRGGERQTLVPGPQASRLADYFADLSSKPSTDNPAHIHENARSRLSNALAGLMQVSSYLGGGLSGAISGMIDSISLISPLANLSIFSGQTLKSQGQSGQFPSRQMAEDIAVSGVRNDANSLNQINAYALAAPNSDRNVPNLRQVLQSVEEQLVGFSKPAEGDSEAVTRQDWQTVRQSWQVNVAQALQQTQNQAIGDAANSMEQLQKINVGYGRAIEGANAASKAIQQLVVTGTSAGNPGAAQHIDALLNFVEMVSAYLAYAQAYNSLYVEGIKAANA